MKVRDNYNQLYNVEIIIDNNTNNKFYRVANQSDDRIVTQKEFNENFHKVAESKTVNYYNELNTLKDKVVERIGKINERINYVDIRLGSIDKKSQEGMKLQEQLDRYEEDKKYYNDILENIKDKIVDFQSIQSRVNIEREIDLAEIYSQLGIDLNELQSRFKNEDESVELIQEKEVNTTEVPQSNKE